LRKGVSRRERECSTRQTRCTIEVPAADSEAAEKASTLGVARIVPNELFGKDAGFFDPAFPL
jgi:hypothetical protein